MNNTNLLYKIVANLIVLSVNINLNKRYILSLSKDDIILPTINFDKNKISNTNQMVIDYLKELNVSNNDLFLIPQIICLDSIYIKSDNNTINPVFGLLVDYNSNIKDCYWYEFEYGIPNQYSDIIIEVAQKLQ
jgi:hypothetical protein